MIRRAQALTRIQTALRRSRIAALIGPRQCGKTTLARSFVQTRSANYFDLEDPADLARLDQPMTVLRPLRGLIVIDEVQRKPDLFPILRVLADRQPLPAKFLILGSASPDLLRQSSESLAGRIEWITIGGFDSTEVDGNIARHWLRGGFPLSYLAKNDPDSFAWRANFMGTLLERDLPQWGINISSAALMRFWSMLAHYHGQIWNAAEPARSLGISEPTARRYLDLLTNLFMIRQLQPWHANLKKRQVKAPKIFVRDTGLLHYLLGIRTEKELFGHPKCGASWEGYIIEETLRSIQPEAAYFWATHNGAELDLLFTKRGKTFGVECKREDAPKLTPSMRIAQGDLKLDRLAVVYPGEKRYMIADRVEAVPFTAVAEGMKGLFPSATRR